MSRSNPPPPGSPSTADPGATSSLRPFGLAALATFAVLAATEPFLSIAWDEGYTLGRVERVRSWLVALADPPAFARQWTPPTVELVQPDGPVPPGIRPVSPPSRTDVSTRSGLLSPPVLLYFWPFAREEPHGHPPFYALVALAGDVLTPWRLELGRARLGTMLVFSLVAGWVHSFFRVRYGSWSALAAVAAFVLQPRLWAHAHYATYDALLTALWVAATLAFFQAVQSPATRWRWTIFYAVLQGAACATKLTGWMIPIPLIAWALLRRDRHAFLTLALAAPLTLITAYVFVPPWWSDPLGGFSRFLASNLGRAASIPIETMFLGRVYNTPAESLPWYNTLAITAMVVPVGVLCLALVGFARSFRAPTDSFPSLVAIHWAFLLLLRSMPHVPGHDVERLFLPAFGCLALSAGLGAGWLVDRFGRWGRGVVIASVVEAAASVLLFMPTPLAYYSPLVGGPAGAQRLGMESTYYWDGLSPTLLRWLNDRTPAGSKVAFSSQPTSLLYLRRTGELTRGLFPNEPGPYRWYVLQNRPGAWRPADRELVRRFRPATSSSKFGVPLVLIYSFDDFLRAAQSVPSPDPR